MLELNFIQGIQINQHDHHTPCMLYKSSSCNSGNHLALVEDLLKKITPCNHHSSFYTISPILSWVTLNTRKMNTLGELNQKEMKIAYLIRANVYIP